MGSGLSELPNGPFLHVKNRGLIWIGVPEQCDRCKELFPMVWVTFDGERYLCTACNWDVNIEKRSDNITVKEDLDLIDVCNGCYRYFTIHQLTIDYNRLVCKKCARKAYEKRMAEIRKEELEKEKLLSADEREKREKELVMAYYDRMCC